MCLVRQSGDMLFTAVVVTVECAFILDCVQAQLKEKEITSEDMTVDLITSDFEKAVKSAMFVDKTMLIKDLLESPINRTFISTPRKFGKSTNIDMIKRFLEITVDENGVPKPITSTSNYELFKKNDLKISFDEEFFEENFGKYPVVYMDYSSLQNVSNYGEFLETFSKIISKSLWDHRYLLKNKRIWLTSFQKTIFESYFTVKDINDIEYCSKYSHLDWLANLLNNHFGKQVIVLINQYDSFAYSEASKDPETWDKIIAILKKVDEDLLSKANNYVRKVVLTGTLVIHRGKFHDQIKDCYFLDPRHSFGPYFGLTEQEVQNLIRTTTTNSAVRQNARKSIQEYYDCYKLYTDGGEFTKLYKTGSIVNVLKNAISLVPHTCKVRSLSCLKSICRVEEIKERVERLITGRTVVVKFNQPFKKDDIFALNQMAENETIILGDLNLQTDRILRLLYSFGYLTPTEKSSPGQGIKCIVPNKFTLNELKHCIEHE